MLTNDNQQKLILKRIEQVVSVLMEEDPIFKQDIDYVKIVEHLVDLVENNLTDEQFNNMSNEKLKDNCSFVMSTELLSKIGQDLTPEQMAILDEAIKRK
ncbi:hypothetical protein [Spirulina subsalsa]|uniref:hypothetical protein n=1 Tax=Spirulina subsalsa TaxID=54311 RepID=UPI0003771CF3|nr:hypothetical protein [Spirulina subsalsa]